MGKMCFFYMAIFEHHITHDSGVAPPINLFPIASLEARLGRRAMARSALA